ncbi:hypothetical protein ACI799_07970 [Blastococcus sp. SYSU DS0753]
MDNNKSDDIRFAEIVLGVTVVDGPPPPGSKLARLIELGEEKDRESHSQEWLNDQARKL